MAEKQDEERKMFERLSMFTSALVGKPIHVTSQKALPENIRKLAPRMALTDGSRIYLPEFEKQEGKEEVYRKYCLEKIMEIGEGTFSLPENERPNFKDFKNSSAASAIFQLLENEQFKHKAKQHFPNAYNNTQEDNSLLSNFLKVARNLPLRQASKLRKYASRYLRIAKQGKGNTKTSLQYTQKIYNLFDFSQREETQSEPSDFLKMFLSQFGISVEECEKESLIKSLESSAITRDKIISKISKDREVKRGELEKAMDEEIEFNGELTGEYTSLSAENVNKRIKGSYEDKRLYIQNPHANPSQEKDLRFDEKDLNSSIGVSLYDSIKEKYSFQITRLKRLFERLKGENYRKTKRQVSGSDIDLEAAVDFTICLKSGEQPDDKVYTDVKRNRRDVCTGILIDMSLSMNGTKIERAKETIAILSESLNHIGDNFAILGFSGGYPNVDIYRIKGFEQRFDSEVKSRISDISAHYQNRDGAAIRYLTDYILQMPNKTKVLFVVSDGSPSDYNYPNAIEDTRRSILEARSKGIRTFCITIDANAERYIEELYGGAPYCICPNPEELPEKAGRFYQEVAF